MKKTLIASLLAVASLAQAHEHWVNAPAKIAADEVLKADLAYGHDYPAAEPIEADRLHIFKPLQLIGMDGKAQDMNQQVQKRQRLETAKPERHARRQYLPAGTNVRQGAGCCRR